MSPPPSNLEGRSQETWERTQTGFQEQGVLTSLRRSCPLETVTDESASELPPGDCNR
ncbi:UNVERIFIED_CONTAM: hypothetical protein FKN15_053891 [Acipenser sinensis]